MIVDNEVLTVEESIELVKWVKDMSEDECRDLLYFFCGYRPALMAKFKAEREDRS